MTCTPTAVVYQLVLVSVYFYLGHSILSLSSPTELLLIAVNYNFFSTGKLTVFRCFSKSMHYSSKHTWKCDTHKSSSTILPILVFYRWDGEEQSDLTWKQAGEEQNNIFCISYCWAFHWALLTVCGGSFIKISISSPHQATGASPAVNTNKQKKHTMAAARKNLLNEWEWIWTVCKETGNMLEAETKSWQWHIAKGMGGVTCAINRLSIFWALQIYGSKHFSCWQICQFCFENLFHITEWKYWYVHAVFPLPLSLRNVHLWPFYLFCCFLVYEKGTFNWQHVFAFFFFFLVWEDSAKMLLYKEKKI